MTQPLTFKQYLQEMTMKTLNISPALQTTFEYLTNKLHKDDLVKIGNLGEVEIMRHEASRSKHNSAPAIPMFVDLLMLQGKPIGIITGKRMRAHDDSHLWQDPATRFVFMLEEWYIVPEHQRKGLGEQYLYFIKTEMKLPLLLGDIHSTATQHLTKKLNASTKLKLSWYNTKTGEIEPFEAEEGKYSTDGPTAWRLLVENSLSKPLN